MQGATPRELAVIGPVPVDGAQAVVHTLLDGMDLVIAGAGLSAPRSLRVLQARARKTGATLLITGTDRVEGADLTVTARCVAAEGIGQGRGRLRAREHQVRLTPRGGRVVHGLLRTEPAAGGLIECTLRSDATAARWTPRLLTGTDS